MSTSRSARERRPTTRPPFVVRLSTVHGRGVFAARDVAAGTLVGEYTGERITVAEAHRRYDHRSVPHAETYLFQVDAETMIDGLSGGNDTRLINHSCDPNCRTVLRGGRIFVEARRDIARGEELFIDYGLRASGGATDADRERLACRCGAASCRGTMLGQSGVD
jgi:uncharacterized protein